MMKKVIFILFWASYCSIALAAESPEAGIAERYSYTMGVRLGQLLKAQDIVQLDSAAFAAAIDDVLAGHPLRLSDEEMQAAVREQQGILAGQRAQRAQDNLEAGREFLAANAGRPEVVVLPSGLQYEVLESGSGAQPTAEDSVRVHYHGTLLDGRVFDSSVERGEAAEFALGAVIPGFREALSNMRIGDHWRVYIPSALAYGERGAGSDIGPNETLIFELQLLDIMR
jgi:FKBP-type peptidyl-prolyl cis-trans isomerase FklB